MILYFRYFGIADISWYERKAASIFFATPPQATYEDALKIFLKAEKMEPNFYRYNILFNEKGRSLFVSNKILFFFFLNEYCIVP